MSRKVSERGAFVAAPDKLYFVIAFKSDTGRQTMSATYGPFVSRDRAHREARLVQEANIGATAFVVGHEITYLGEP